MVESGLKELGATILAGMVLVAIADFIFLKAGTRRFLAPSFSADGGGMTSGYTPTTQTSPGQGGLPDPVTC